MEAGGLIAEVGWTEFDFLSHGEESEVMAQLLGAFPSHGEEGQHELLHWPDEASNAYSDSVPPACEGYYFLSNSNEALGSSSCAAPGALGSVQEEHSAAEYLNLIANHSHSFNCYGNGDPSCEDLDDPMMGVSMPGSVSAAPNKSKRKHMVEEHDGQAQTRGRKCSRSAGEAKRSKKSGDEAIASGSPTSCCTSDSDSNASLESADADADADADACRPKGKGRAGRGTTTEPQSIYARKRRERINERLKILQGLVPNGTKVDISTMLEEAVHYVKFLQVQIRLLSSDDTWMYAPIAYNGMNIGIDLNLDR